MENKGIMWLYILTARRVTSADGEKDVFPWRISSYDGGKKAAIQAKDGKNNGQSIW